MSKVLAEIARFQGAEAPGVVAGYVPTAGEIDPTPAMQEVREMGWKLALPICGPDASMEFAPWAPDDALVANRYGIGEPLTTPLHPSVVDLVLVPGVGFGRDGSRVGHGVGYYDRYFARCRSLGHDPFRIGVAYDLQVVTLPEPEPWDVGMDVIICPSEVIMIGDR